MRGENTFAGLATPENTDAEIVAIIESPHTYDWVKRVAVEALSHDCVDAVVALEVLAEAFKRRNSCIYEGAVRKRIAQQDAEAEAEAIDYLRL